MMRRSNHRAHNFSVDDMMGSQLGFHGVIMTEPDPAIKSALMHHASCQMRPLIGPAQPPRLPPRSSLHCTPTCSVHEV